MPSACANVARTAARSSGTSVGYSAFRLSFCRPYKIKPSSIAVTRTSSISTQHARFSLNPHLSATTNPSDKDDSSIIGADEDTMARPTGLIANKGIELLTWGTPNGYKASILLEELKDAYGLEYTTQAINISQDIQKEPWFVAINPNGRIPAIVDHDNGGLAVFEGIAILGYLSRRYDTENLFSFAVDDDDYTRAETWIGWQHGGLGPMQGQANHFLRAAKEKIPYSIQRYVGETERLYGVLDARLADRDYVVGPGRGRYSIADISLLGWVNSVRGSTVDISRFPAVEAWFRRCTERPAVLRGLAVPSANKASLVVEPDEEFVAKNAELKALVDQAKDKYGYKYVSP